MRTTLRIKRDGVNFCLHSNSRTYGPVSDKQRIRTGVDTEPFEKFLKALQLVFSSFYFAIKMLKSSLFARNSAFQSLKIEQQSIRCIGLFQELVNLSPKEGIPF